MEPCPSWSNLNAEDLLLLSGNRGHAWRQVLLLLEEQEINYQGTMMLVYCWVFGAQPWQRMKKNSLDSGSKTDGCSRLYGGCK